MMYAALVRVAWGLLLSVAIVSLYAVLDPLKAAAHVDVLSYAVSTALMFIGLGVVAAAAWKGVSHDR